MTFSKCTWPSAPVWWASGLGKKKGRVYEQRRNTRVKRLARGERNEEKEWRKCETGALWVNTSFTGDGRVERTESERQKDKERRRCAKESEVREKKKTRGEEKENQYFSSVTTQATANDSKHHEKIWEQGQERNEKDKRTVKWMTSEAISYGACHSVPILKLYSYAES